MKCLPPVVVLGLAAVAAFAAGYLASGAGSAEVAQATECAGDSCERFGIPGACVHGVCVLGQGACARDIDCSDDNPCTVDSCDLGKCATANRTGACEAPKGPGVCELGLCELAAAAECTGDADCAAPANACAQAACIDGRCAKGPRADGVECSTAAGRSGSCAAGRCEVAAAGERKVKCRNRWYAGIGWLPDCRRDVRFELSEEELRAAETAIEKRIADQLRYDMKAALVALPGGGYNLVVHNRRDRHDVRGLCDPSFVAFDVAGYTAQTNWKSANLHVWLRPYTEGWTVPTQGSRAAVNYGKAHSPLGMYGVVEVKAFRSWLEQTFKPLVADADPTAKLERADVLPPLPAAAPGEPAVAAAGAVQAAADAGTPATPESIAASVSQPGAASTMTPGVVPAHARAPEPSGEALLREAWRHYESGRLAASRKSFAQARRLGHHDADLETLLEE